MLTLHTVRGCGIHGSPLHGQQIQGNIAQVVLKEERENNVALLETVCAKNEQLYATNFNVM